MRLTRESRTRARIVRDRLEAALYTTLSHVYYHPNTSTRLASEMQILAQKILPCFNHRQIEIVTPKLAPRYSCLVDYVVIQCIIYDPITFILSSRYVHRLASEMQVLAQKILLCSNHCQIEIVTPKLMPRYSHSVAAEIVTPCSCWDTVLPCGCWDASTLWPLRRSYPVAAQIFLPIWLFSPTTLIIAKHLPPHCWLDAYIKVTVDADNYRYQRAFPGQQKYYWKF